MKYKLDDKLGVGASLLYGLQWLVVIVPSIITMGLLLGKIHFGTDVIAQTFYMQKLFFVLGITLLVQILCGHRLPLVVGPASVLLVGVLSSLPASFPAIYTAIMLGGILLTAVSAFGLLKYIQSIFTPRVIITIMLLIPLTLGPSIINLVFGNNNPATFNLLFIIIVCIALLLMNNLFKGIWKSTTLVIGIIISTLVYTILIKPSTLVSESVLTNNSINLFIKPEFDAGVILAFIFCAIALMINEVSSIEAVGQMLSASNMQKRTKRGVAVTGLSNILAGSLGVIGPIDYSLSTGIIASSRCASRFPFIPAAILLIICSFIPFLINSLLLIPNIVMGSILLYVMTSQFSAGFQMLIRNNAISDFNEGVVIGLSLMIALLVSFMPSDISVQITPLLRPILANGFVMGVIMVLIMEHIIYRKKKLDSSN